MQSTYSTLKSLVVAVEIDILKSPTNRSAGTRARSSLLQVKKLADALRKDILSQYKKVIKLEPVIEQPEKPAIEQPAEPAVKTRRIKKKK